MLELLESRREVFAGCCWGSLKKKAPSFDNVATLLHIVTETEGRNYIFKVLNLEDTARPIRTCRTMSTTLELLIYCNFHSGNLYLHPMFTFPLLLLLSVLVLIFNTCFSLPKHPPLIHHFPILARLKAASTVESASSSLVFTSASQSRRPEVKVFRLTGFRYDDERRQHHRRARIHLRVNEYLVNYGWGRNRMFKSNYSSLLCPVSSRKPAAGPEGLGP